MGEDSGMDSEPSHERAPAGGAEGQEEARRRRERWFETISTLILALAALATAWSSYQSALWDGIQSSDYSRASALRTESSLNSSQASQVRLAHLDLITNYVDARVGGDQALATFYRERFPPPLEVAFEAWIAQDPFTNPDAAPSPLSMPEYVLDQDRTAAELTVRADQEFAAGEAANSVSDVYTLATVLFAAALFFAAISERFEVVPARVLLLSIGSLSLVGGLVVGLGQPIASG